VGCVVDQQLKPNQGIVFSLLALDPDIEGFESLLAKVLICRRNAIVNLSE